jgi:hypothetical protein
MMFSVVFCVLLSQSDRLTRPCDLKPTAEQLSLAEAQLIREEALASGIGFYTREEGPGMYSRELVVPEKLLALYAKKRKATLRALLTVVEHGNPYDAILASGYIASLSKNPLYGALSTRCELWYFEQQASVGAEFDRKRLHDQCVKFIIENDTAN